MDLVSFTLLEYDLIVMGREMDWPIHASIIRLMIYILIVHNSLALQLLSFVSLKCLQL